MLKHLSLCLLLFCLRSTVGAAAGAARGASAEPARELARLRRQLAAAEARAEKAEASLRRLQLLGSGGGGAAATADGAGDAPGCAVGPLGPSPLEQTRRLRRGVVELPVLGLGGALWGEGVNSTAAFASAFAAGYTAVEASPAFGGEVTAALGTALRERPPGSSSGAVQVLARIGVGEGMAGALSERLAALTEALGLGGKHDGGGGAVVAVLVLDGFPRSAAERVAVWREALAIREAGRVQALGVSNWGVRQLRDLERHFGAAAAAEGRVGRAQPIHGADELPELVQAELHVFLQQPAGVGVRAWCEERGIAVLAYGALGGRGGGGGGGGGAEVRELHPQLLSAVRHPTLAAIGRAHEVRPKRLVIESPWLQFAGEYQRFGHPPRLNHQPFWTQVSAAAVALRWCLQRRTLVLVGASSAAHQRSNDAELRALPSLSEREMADIAVLDLPELRPVGLYAFGDPADRLDSRSDPAPSPTRCVQNG
jgi:diketogulonate reductase-like aldo/keto reductase